VEIECCGGVMRMKRSIECGEMMMEEKVTRRSPNVEEKMGGC